MCGTVVSASASECPGCGEQFSPVEETTIEPSTESDYDQETVTEETEEVFVRDDAAYELQEHAHTCETCNGPLDGDEKCPACQPEVRMSKTSLGCPLCDSKNYSVESGDLVSCSDCGNVYVKKDFEPEPQNWKWKFWVGLVFILVGNVGVALGSYIHNVVQWSPLGDMYLGYGWMDQIVGAVGIILFILGLILFAWSFKREREMECPSCKLVIRESQFELYEPPEEEEDIPKEDAVRSALDEIDEMMECPSCGASVSMFDTSCGNCGAAFDMDIGVIEPAPEPDDPIGQEPETPGRLLSASEIDQDKIIADSIALEENGFELDESLELENLDQRLEANGLAALDELESAFQISMVEGKVCPTCGARVSKALDACPGCGEKLNGGE